MKSCEDMFSNLCERRDKYLKERERKKRATVRTAVPVLCLCLILAGFFAIRPQIFDSGDPTGTDSPVSDTVFGEETKYTYLPSWIAVVYYNGCEYQYRFSDWSDLNAGEKLGVVEYDIKEYFMKDEKIPEGAIKSTSISVGSAIYACEGYSTEFRICAYNSWLGKYECYERVISEDENNIDFSSLMPDSSLVESMDICTGYPKKIGEITEKETVQKAAKLLFENSVFTENKKGAFSFDDRLIIYINYNDGSTSELYLYGPDYGRLVNSITIPTEFYGIMKDNIISSAEDYVRRGGLYSSWDNWYDDSGHYSADELIIIDGKLYIGAANDVVLAENVWKDITRENEDIWYLDAFGNVIHLRMDFGESSGLESDIRAGNDISKHIKLKETAFEGPYTELIVYDGVVYTLDENGALFKDGKIAMGEVNCFSVDSRGVIIGKSDGLFRVDINGHTEKLSNGDIKAVISAGIDVYYSTDSETWRIRADGKNSKKLLDVGGVTLCFDSEEHYSAFGMKGNIALLTESGECYMLKGDRYLYHIDSGADAFEIFINEIFIFKDGILLEKRFGMSTSDFVMDFGYQDVKIQPTVVG